MNNQQQFVFGNNANNQQRPAFSFGINIDDEQPDFDNTNDEQTPNLPLSFVVDKVFVLTSPIIKAIKILDDIHQPIKNKYVGIDELTTFIEKTEILLKLAIESKNFLLTNILPSLDVIFPAIDHLKLFLSDADMGAIALVSKNLYNLMISNYGKLNVDIYIAKHYIDNDAYDYSVDVNYHTMVPKDINHNNHIRQYGELPKNEFHHIRNTFIKGKIPLKVKTIALKRLRKLIGAELYFSEHKIIFFKDDIMYLYDKYEETIPDNSKVCMFCYNLKCRRHGFCYQEFVDKTKRDILFDNHVKNATLDKEFKYFLHHLNKGMFTRHVVEENTCQFCSDPNSELCTVIYQDISDNNYCLKEGYRNYFDLYHVQSKLVSFSNLFLNSTQEQRIKQEKNERKVKSYSFCIYPEFEYIYGQSKNLDK